MTKEEFISFSLPYGLKCFSSNTGLVYKVLSCHFGNQILARVQYTDNQDFPLPVSCVMPILRPVSDLTKEIEHKGEKFVPAEWFEISDDNNLSLEFDYGNIKLISNLTSISKNNCHHDINYLPFQVVQKLNEWHFDIAGLIEKGEAIDINTLPENPYK